MVLAAGVLLAACGGGAASTAPVTTGVILVDLDSGAVRGARQLGVDPIAVAVSPDGRTAFVSDNAGGRVSALALPGLAVRWTAVVGGRPGPLLPTLDTVFVSLYEADQVVALQSADGAEAGRQATCHGPGQLALVAGAVVASCAHGGGFALAATESGAWFGDYEAGRLARDDGLMVALPPHLHPFWLAARPGGGVYVAAEGDDEDADPGAVLAVDQRGAVAVLARPHDPDQVEPVRDRLFVAAHADHEVTVLQPGGGSQHWARGSGAIALAADLPLRLLVVVVNARE